MAFKQVKVLKLFPFFESFFYFVLEKYRANSQVKCSIEKPDLGNLLFFTGHDLFLRSLENQVLNFASRNFLIFLENYTINSEMKSSIDRRVCAIFFLQKRLFLNFLLKFSHFSFILVTKSVVFEITHFVPNQYNKFKTSNTYFQLLPDPRCPSSTRMNFINFFRVMFFYCVVLQVVRSSTSPQCLPIKFFFNYKYLFSVIVVGIQINFKKVVRVEKKMSYFFFVFQTNLDEIGWKCDLTGLVLLPFKLHFKYIYLFSLHLSPN